VNHLALEVLHAWDVGVARLGEQPAAVDEDVTLFLLLFLRLRVHALNVPHAFLLVPSRRDDLGIEGRVVANAVLG
jgi:hypothetical protein